MVTFLAADYVHAQRERQSKEKSAFVTMVACRIFFEFSIHSNTCSGREYMYFAFKVGNWIFLELLAESFFRTLRSKWRWWVHSMYLYCSLPHSWQHRRGVLSSAFGRRAERLLHVASDRQRWASRSAVDGPRQSFTVASMSEVDVTRILFSK